MVHARLVAVLFAALLFAPGLGSAQTPLDQGGEEAPRGRLLSFNATRFNDTLFAGLEPTYRASFDEAGDVWYATQAGVVHVDVDARTRRLYTRVDGLPSSFVMSVATSPGKVYAATDLGLAILDRASGKWRAFHTWDSPLPDAIVREVVVDGTELWIGTHFGFVTTLNITTLQWGAEKNVSTRADWGKPVRRIVPTLDDVWVGTDGDGAWRYDRATGNWSVTLRSDGLASNTVLAIAELDGDTWFGTDLGLQRRDAAGAWRLWNESNGMPDERVYDLDTIPTIDGPLNVFAATRSGVWQLDPETGAHQRLAQEFGILGDVVIDETWTEENGWIFATSRGISHLRTGGWNYYTTGPSSGASSGPLSHRFTAAYAGNSEPFLWFGSDDGIAAFLPANEGGRGVWYNFGEWQNYPGSVVNLIDVAGNTTWVATNAGVIGYDVETDEWIELPVAGSRNLAYAVDAEMGEVWIPLFGDGLIMRNLTTGLQRSWTYQSLPEPIPDQLLTDVRVAGDEVWLGSSVGVIRMNRVAGTFIGTYTVADGLPGTGVVFRLLPDGNVVWVGMKDGGVARLDVGSGKVTRVWNTTSVPGYPGGEASEVRSLHREGGRLWAGTKGGLVRIDVASGAAKVYNQTNSDLVQEYVNGIASQDGILYLATASGVSRLDIASDRFLPMREGPDAQTVGAPVAARTTPVNVRIDSPRDGAGVTGTVEVRGSASRFGGRIDAVEVRVGAGPWTPAVGAESWTYAWDSATATADQPVTIAARARSGNETSRVVEILVTPVQLPTIPLELKHVPIANATALRPLLVAATITGDEPLTASLYYKVPGGDIFKRLALQRQGSVFSASVPASEMREGTLQYYVEAKSGSFLTASSPEDVQSPHRVAIGPPPSLAVAVEGPARLQARAGETTRVALNVTNAGTEDATFVVSASGVRASWLTVPSDPLPLRPGETREVVAELTVPREAFADNTTLNFEVRDATGEADPARAAVPVEVLANASARPTVPSTPAPRGIPATALLSAVALAGAALVLGRRRE